MCCIRTIRNSLGIFFHSFVIKFSLIKLCIYSSKMATKTQDMPPKGGYQKIEFKRIPARKYFSGYQMILGYIGKYIRYFVKYDGY